MVTFRARFTGICAYIPDLEFGDPQNCPTTVTILMIDGRPPLDGKAKLALDGDLIRPHAPIIEFDPSDLVDGISASDVRLRWFIDRKKISFRIREADKAPRGTNDFTVVQGLKEDLPSFSPSSFGANPGAERDFNWGVHIKNVVKFSDELVIDRRFLDDAQSKGSVVAKVVLEEYGELSSFSLDSGTTFEIASQLEGEFMPSPLSEQVALEFKDTDSVTLIVEDLDGSVDPVEFEFDTSGLDPTDPPVDVLIGNLCCDNIIPRFDDGSAPVQRSDEDFRWYYELFDGASRNRILDSLDGLGLPVPFPIRSDGGGAGLKPVQCMRLSLHVPPRE